MAEGANGSDNHESEMVAKGKLGALIKGTPEIYGGENTYFSLNLVRFLSSVIPDLCRDSDGLVKKHWIHNYPIWRLKTAWRTNGVPASKEMK